MKSVLIIYLDNHPNKGTDVIDNVEYVERNKGDQNNIAIIHKEDGSSVEVSEAFIEKLDVIEVDDSNKVTAKTPVGPNDVLISYNEKSNDDYGMLGDVSKMIIKEEKIEFEIGSFGNYAYKDKVEYLKHGDNVEVVRK